MRKNKEIPESSVLFQGHTNQFFSMENTSFIIKELFSDLSATNELNTLKYLPIYLKKINNFKLKSVERLVNQAHENNTKIEVLKLVDNEDEVCGEFEISPREAFCTEDGCRHFFDIDEGKGCNHSKYKNWDQLTFMAFCEICGRIEKLRKVTNIENICTNCKTEKGMVKLGWANRGDLSTYTVSCKKCKNKESLWFNICKHGGKLPDQDVGRFRPVTARYGTVRHPIVHTILDYDKRYFQNRSEGKKFSNKFNKIFGSDFHESLLLNKNVIEELNRNDDFWNLTDIERIEKYGMKKTRSLWNNDDWQNFYQKIFTSLFIYIDDDSDKDAIFNLFGINIIKSILIKYADSDYSVDFDDDIFVDNPNADSDPELPRVTKWSSYNQLNNEINKLRDVFGIRDVLHISNIKIIQGLLGYIEGSMRREDLVFKTIIDNNKNLVYLRDFLTEALVFRFDKKRIIEWLKNNNLLNIDIIKLDIDTDFATIINSDEEIRNAVYTLFHTFSHLLIQVSDEFTGLGIQSIGEKIEVETGSVILYSTNNINCGGLEDAFEKQLLFWLYRTQNLSKYCPQDPACMIDEFGACNACSFLPEFVCCNYNQDLDRSALSTNHNTRFAEGYLK